MTRARRQAEQALVASPSSQQAVSTEGFDPSRFDPSRFKPSLAFLRKVEAGDVRRVRGYSPRKGGYHRFIGSEKQWDRHCRAGYVTRPPIPDLGRPGVVTLTEKGRAAIATEAQRAATTGAVHEGAGRRHCPKSPG